MAVRAEASRSTPSETHPISAHSVETPDPRARLQELLARSARSLVWGFAALLIVPILAAFFTGFLGIDVLAVIGLALVPAIRRGSLRALKYALVLMMWYALVPLSALIIMSVVIVTGHGAGILRVSGRFLSSSSYWYVAPICLGLLTWAIGTGILLRKASILARLLEQGRCRACGYDLRGSLETGRCPECGRPFDASTVPVDVAE